MSNVAFIGLFSATLVAFLYGLIRHAYRTSDVAAYHGYWPCTGDCCGDLALYNNPHHHPNHCWNYFDHPGTDSWYPNLLNTTYPPRQKMDVDYMPYSNSTSYIYVVLGCVIVIMSNYVAETDNRRFDIGGIFVSLAWVGASSAEFHRNPTELTRHNDWAMIAPLLAIVGADGMRVEWWWPSKSRSIRRLADYMVKLVCVFPSIYLGYYSPTIAILYGFAALSIGYICLFGVFLRNRMDLKHLLNISIIIPLAFSAVACKSYGNNPNSMGAASFLFPNHEFEHYAQCTNDVNAARLSDIAHGWWHILICLSLAFLVLPQLGLEPLDSPVSYACVSIVPAGILACAYFVGENKTLSYTAWWIVSLVSLVSASVGLYFTRTRDKYKAVDVYAY